MLIVLCVDAMIVITCVCLCDDSLVNCCKNYF